MFQPLFATLCSELKPKLIKSTCWSLVNSLVQCVKVLFCNQPAGVHEGTNCQNNRRLINVKLSSIKCYISWRNFCDCCWFTSCEQTFSQSQSNNWTWVMVFCIRPPGGGLESSLFLTIGKQFRTLLVILLGRLQKLFNDTQVEKGFLYQLNCQQSLIWTMIDGLTGTTKLCGVPAIWVLWVHTHTVICLMWKFHFCLQDEQKRLPAEMVWFQPVKPADETYPGIRIFKTSGAPFQFSNVP